MAHPLLYEINARHWVSELSLKYGRPINLASIPEAELTPFQRNGFTHIWLMGVWPTGPQSRGQAVAHSDLRKAYDEALPGWTEEDIHGSPYAVGALHVSPFLGGDAALASLRTRLAGLGIKLILDFVPNHLGLDHEWVRSRPHLFVHQAHPFSDSFPLELPSGTRYLAHGKDPYFPGWTDTVQLDYRRDETRQAMTGLIHSIAGKCDGVRCDMAMLLLSNVFHRTWNHIPFDFEAATGEFWQDAIAEIKRDHPEFLFLAEAYWDLESQLCNLGFDYAYDKRLYDLVVHDQPWEVQPHLLGLGSENIRRAHFLENHDEPRIAGTVDLALHRAATALALGLPGMRFLHDGQFEGLKRFARVQLSRRAEEPVDPQIRDIYQSLLPAFAESMVGQGDGQLLTPRRAWEDNPTAQCFTAIQWQIPGRSDQFDLVVVNLAPHQAQCRLDFSVPQLAAGSWTLSDRIGPEVWVRSGNELAQQGLYLDVVPRGAHLFSFVRE